MAEDVMAQWQYQVRFDVGDTSASEAIRQNAPKFTQLFEVLARHRAVAKSQFVAFSDYVSTAEQEGIENYPPRIFLLHQSSSSVAPYTRTFPLLLAGSSARAVHRPQHPDPRVKVRSFTFRCHDQRLDSGLPVRFSLLGLR
jgi:hypothetical protein